MTSDGELIAGLFALLAEPDLNAVRIELGWLAKRLRREMAEATAGAEKPAA